MFEQRFVEHFYSIGIGKINRFVSIRINRNKPRKFWQIMNQLFEIIPLAMQVSLMQAGLFGMDFLRFLRQRNFSDYCKIDFLLSI